MIFEGKIIVNECVNKGLFSYQIIEDILDYKEGDCIIIKSMNPDYSMLLDQISIIIAERGSPVSHLAIIAREYNKTVIIVDNIVKKIPPTGRLNISVDEQNAKIQVI